MRYAKRGRITSPPSSESPSKAVSASWKLYQDCSKLELDRFLDVLYDKDFDRLIIEGQPPEQVIKDAWNKIYLQYTELANDGSHNEVLDKVTQVNVLNGRIILINGIVAHLEIGYDEDLVKMLNQLGIPCDLKADEDPAKKLKAVNARAKRMVVQMEILQKELYNMQETTEKVQGRDYYDDWLDALSRNRMYAVKAKDITVTQFFRAIKRLNEESVKNQMKHARG
jgi:hypothetical protein